MRRDTPTAVGLAVTQIHGETALHVKVAQLRSTAPRQHGADDFVAHLCSPGLSGGSYVVGHGVIPPTRIVLEYSDGHERLWRKVSRGRDGIVSFTLVEDSGSGGYVSRALV
jgi:hypothetical protein